MTAGERATRDPVDSGVRPWIELGALLAVLELKLWVLTGLQSRTWNLLAYAVLAAIFWVSFRRLAAGGALLRYTLPRPGPAWAEALVATAVLGVIVYVLGAFTRDVYDDPRLALPVDDAAWLGRALVTLLALAVGAQFLLHLFLVPLCREIVRHDATARAAAAGLFGLLHLPGAITALLAFLAAATWSWLYRRREYLAPLVVSYAVLAVVATATLPERLTLDLRPGLRGFQRSERYQPLRNEGVRQLLRTVTSNAYYEAHGSSSRGFLGGLYRDLLDREPDPSELESWLPVLQETSRGTVAKGFATSPEFRQRLAREPELLRRDETR